MPEKSQQAEDSTGDFNIENNIEKINSEKRNSEKKNIQNSQEDNREDILVIRPSIFKALLSGIFRVAFLLLIIFGSYKFIVFNLGEDPFQMIFEIAGIEQPLLLEAVKFVICMCSLIYIFYVVISINLLKLEFLEDRVLFYSGVIMLCVKPINYLDIVRINFRKHTFAKTGKIILELSGEELQNIQIPFVSNIGEKITAIKDVISKAQLRGLSNQLYKASKGEIEKEIINKLLAIVRKEQFSRQDFVSDIINISKEKKLDKDVFEVILTHMLKTHKIEKKEVVEVLFELMEEEILSRKDISDVLFKINSQGF